MFHIVNLQFTLEHHEHIYYSAIAHNGQNNQ